ncbi:SPFH domain / Band 7 family protein [Mycolicibacterium neoaurum]|uniref:SPFH domain-containing protein n=1 Tax=Mycolicibacterium neoaurum TaxID=1795 RepID=UPI000561C058|nr:SPFH domain-containing protein [Mycolicibacterium neoaurum]SDE48802.1 SPFH domain / Band 7 family protein [Mycolicibacterium neoaurum]
MAVITRYPLIRHLRVAPTAHIRALRSGKVSHDGAGLAFWFRPLTAALSEIPLDDRELPLFFHARTADFQDVTVQATVTYRIVDPALAAARIDFAIDVDTGAWRAAPLEQVAGLLTESAQQHALDLLARTALTDALVDGITAVRERMSGGLTADPRLAETGIAVIGVRVVAIRPEPEVERALQTPTREKVQQDADKATFERRALAVERERAIGENELQTKIELARREEELVAQNGANDRLKTQESWAADAIATEAKARREVALAEAQAQAARLVGAAEADAEAARLAAYRDLDEATLIGLAVKELAANLPKVEHLVLTPDLLAPVLARLGATS